MSDFITGELILCDGGAFFQYSCFIKKTISKEEKKMKVMESELCKADLPQNYTLIKLGAEADQTH